jgi:hypothetical protein
MQLGCLLGYCILKLVQHRAASTDAQRDFHRKKGGADVTPSLFQRDRLAANQTCVLNRGGKNKDRSNADGYAD